ncbi:DUF1846 family protein [Candidatus Dojkabacteria bacterium]|nr:DUF1846 family protein [Candidatus Dojkabacteria bacterium]
MITSSDTIEYKRVGFDNSKYRDAQQNALKERISKFDSGRLYLEIGGKFLHDPHASRVLPGFIPEVKIEIFKNIGIPFDIVFCINAKDLKTNRFLKSDDTSYIAYTDRMIADYEKQFSQKPFICLNLINEDNRVLAMEYRVRMEGLGFKVFNRYFIEGYPNAEKVVSADGYGKDEYIPNLSKLVLVVGVASNSGKMSTCLGQIYHDKQRGEDSGYAKYETFPIWNLPINHPVNLAYEAATVDIGDFNMIDKYHLYNHNVTAVNYNRDVAAFGIVESIIKEIVNGENFISTYKSPTDMGVNMAKEGITDDEVVAVAGYNEIMRRKAWYYELREKNPQAQKWSERCDEIGKKAMKYIENKKYNLNLEL